jgi:hypothetical protein
LAETTNKRDGVNHLNRDQIALRAGALVAEGYH